MQTIEARKLNLGCRDTRIPGFSGVDINPDVRGVDIVGDVSNLAIIPSDSIEEIYSSNVLEHFPHVRTLDVLKEWNRVLKKDGILWLSVPDFDAILNLYKVKKSLNQWMINQMYGDQIYPEAFHYTIFTWPNLREQLDASGFSRAERIRELPYMLKDSSHNVDTITRQPVSLNIKSIK